MVTEDYVSFETARLLKKKGFDEECRQYLYVDDNYDNRLHHFDEGVRNSEYSKWLRERCYFGESYAVPTLQMTMKWLREKGLYVNVLADCRDAEHDDFGIVYRMMVFDGVGNHGTYEFPTYEDACEEGIRYCLENKL